jgi:hypothetical protein
VATMGNPGDRPNLLCLAYDPVTYLQAICGSVIQLASLTPSFARSM